MTVHLNRIALDGTLRALRSIKCGGAASKSRDPSLIAHAAPVNGRLWFRKTPGWVGACMHECMRAGRQEGRGGEIRLRLAAVFGTASGLAHSLYHQSSCAPSLGWKLLQLRVDEALARPSHFSLSDKRKHRSAAGHRMLCAFFEEPVEGLADAKAGRRSVLSNYEKTLQSFSMNLLESRAQSSRTNASFETDALKRRRTDFCCRILSIRKSARNIRGPRR